MPVSAGILGNPHMTTFITLIYMTPKLSSVNIFENIIATIK